MRLIAALILSPFGNRKLLTFLARPNKGDESVLHISCRNGDKTEDGMKRERTLQVVFVLVGLFYSFWGYFSVRRSVALQLA